MYKLRREDIFAYADVENDIICTQESTKNMEELLSSIFSVKLKPEQLTFKGKLRKLPHLEPFRISREAIINTFKPDSLIVKWFKERKPKVINIKDAFQKKESQLISAINDGLEEYDAYEELEPVVEPIEETFEAPIVFENPVEEIVELVENPVEETIEVVEQPKVVNTENAQVEVIDNDVVNEKKVEIEILEETKVSLKKSTNILEEMESLSYVRRTTVSVNNPTSNDKFVEIEQPNVTPIKEQTISSEPSFSLYNLTTLINLNGSDLNQTKLLLGMKEQIIATVTAKVNEALIKSNLIDLALTNLNGSNIPVSLEMVDQLKEELTLYVNSDVLTEELKIKVQMALQKLNNLVMPKSYGQKVG